MTAREILGEIRTLGGRIEARGDRLHVEAPKGVLRPEHRQILAACKIELLAILKGQEQADSLDAENSWEWISERAAILESDGGLEHEAANIRAFELWFRLFVNRRGGQ